MSSFPTTIYNPRTVDNVPNTVYDPLETERIFAEDVNDANDEIVVIETTLGLEPQGDFATVAERLDHIETKLFPGAEVKNADFTAESGRIYVCTKSSSRCQIALPATSAAGDYFYILGTKAARFTVNAGGTQKLANLSSDTYQSFQSNSRFDAQMLICTGDNTWLSLRQNTASFPSGPPP